MSAADLDEDNAARFDRDEVDLAVGRKVVACDDPQPLATEVSGSGTLGATAEPAFPPGLPLGHRKGFKEDLTTDHTDDHG